jgi:hypothetical protein
MKSWQTTLGGSITAMGGALMGAGALDWIPQAHKYPIMLVGFVLTVLGPFLTGLFSTSTAHTKRIEADVKEVKAATDFYTNPDRAQAAAAQAATKIIPLFMLALCLAGCATSGKLLASTVATVDAAMKSWANLVAAGQTTPAQETAVKDAYETYQAAELIAENSYIAFIKSGDATAWNRSAAALRDSRDALLHLVNRFAPP